jgi:glycosyltransferase involved in cell wall biosynthesis
MKILIIIPAYNVSTRIRPVLSLIKQYKTNTIVIDDGSTDDTINHINSHSFTCIRHDRNIGMGGAIKSGVKYGMDNDYTHAISMDADGQHDGRFIVKFLEALQFYDFVIGKRFAANYKIPSQKLSSNLFASSIVNDIFKSSLHDVTCGFRGFKINAQYLEIKDNGYGFVYEQLFYTLRSNITMTTVEIPTIYYMNELLSTRCSEINSFLNSLSNYATGIDKEWLSNLKIEIADRKDLEFSVGKRIFYGFYIKRNDSYIFQTNL